MENNTGLAKSILMSTEYRDTDTASAWAKEQARVICNSTYGFGGAPALDKILEYNKHLETVTTSIEELRYTQTKRAVVAHYETLIKGHIRRNYVVTGSQIVIKSCIEAIANSMYFRFIKNNVDVLRLGKEEIDVNYEESKYLIEDRFSSGLYLEKK